MNDAKGTKLLLYLALSGSLLRTRSVRSSRQRQFIFCAEKRKAQLNMKKIFFFFFFVHTGTQKKLYFALGRVQG